MVLTNYFKSVAFAVRWFREDHPEAENPVQAVNELVRQNIIKIGLPPNYFINNRYAVFNGRYCLLTQEHGL